MRGSSVGISSDPGFASDAYLRAKAHWKGLPLRKGPGRNRVASGSEPFGGGRDPQVLGQILAGTTRDLGWKLELEQARLIAEWAVFIGEITAEHTEITELREGTLIVQCDSTAWATELRRLRGEILTRVMNEYPNAEIREMRFLAPGAPSWRHGRRSVPGRGPRDTYG
ncbi:DUF721 domain-containing protein [Leucobacter sp. W1478]|uniref:DUF721 domain-containing protein n=1 Tax=Leucobacter sp. W1478 TaxID=3439065 RepID=UPI003F3DEC96